MMLLIWAIFSIMALAFLRRDPVPVARRLPHPRIRSSRRHEQRTQRAFVLGVFRRPGGAGAGPLRRSTGAETQARSLTDLAAVAAAASHGSADFSSLSGGFAANILISLWAMLLALAPAACSGVGLIAQSGLVRVPSDVVMNVLRNSPWLVVLYAILYLLPFEALRLRHSLVPVAHGESDVGLALPVTANIAEVFRGGVAGDPQRAMGIGARARLPPARRSCATCRATRPCL